MANLFRCGGDNRKYIIKNGVLQSGYSLLGTAPISYQAGYVQTSGTGYLYVPNIDVISAKKVEIIFTTSSLANCPVIGMTDVLLENNSNWLNFAIGSYLNNIALTGSHNFITYVAGANPLKIYDLWYE